MRISAKGNEASGFDESPAAEFPVPRDEAGFCSFVVTLCALIVALPIAIWLSKAAPLSRCSGTPRFASTLDSDHHRLYARKLFDARFAEPRFTHPFATICAGVVETTLRFEQHHQTHQQAVYIFSALVVDKVVIHDERTAARQGVVRFL